MQPPSVVVRVGGRVGFFLSVALLLAAGDVPLFPTPLHLVRQLDDPISQKSSQVDEYCVGNRIITIDRYRTVIVDYEKQEILQIDRAAATYSVTSFDEVAAANRATRRSAVSNETWKTAVRGSAAFELSNGGITIELSIDRLHAISRNAFDALTGAAYPNVRTAQLDAIASVAARPSIASIDSTASYGIPVEQSMTVDAGREGRFTIHNSVVSIDQELPPPELLAIPAGARLVASRTERLRQSLEGLKEPAPHP